MGLSNKTAAKWGLAGFLAMIASSAVAEANRIARDPTTGPAAHTASLAATILVWSNWVTAVLAVPLAVFCLLYYIAVLYESKLYARLRAIWQSWRGIS